MTTYWSILEKIPGSKLRLTKIDDEIYEHFKKEFPDYDPKSTINEDEMKSKAGKDRWRNFVNQYENKVDDYNFGTLLRSNPAFEYSQDETIFGTAHDHSPWMEFSWFKTTAVRMQFYALEILRYAFKGFVLNNLLMTLDRNREGLNDWVYEKAQAEKASW
jgi:hypothetical protein